ncbi:hypothetical protein [Neisseria sp.]|uniref:hypothetical protein n=1 Tax=Neisseria sp. TaxID=192066 RepID=UPI0026DCE2B7|nr:hypothetical protein [Neisseria sp.]MDO4226973.1 hypothetical protein [Neisseria sp.]
MEISENERGCNHWLLKRGYQVNPHLGKAILLCKLECEYWLENMTVSDIDKALVDIDKIVSYFDNEMQNIQYLKKIDEYVIDILPPMLYQNQTKNKSSFPKADEIPLSVKILALSGKIQGLTRNHLLAAAYRRIVQDYYQWETITDVLKTAARNADKFGYHISVMYDPAKVFELMADVSALLALASNMDIAARGTMSFSDLKSHFERRSARERAVKSGEIRGEQKRKAQAAFLAAKEKKPETFSAAICTE